MQFVILLPLFLGERRQFFCSGMPVNTGCDMLKNSGPCTKFKLDGPEFKLDALEFLTARHLVKNDIWCRFYGVSGEARKPQLKAKSWLLIRNFLLLQITSKLCR